MRTILLFCGWLLAAQALAQALPEKVGKPVFRLGDTWVYNKLDGASGDLLGVSTNTLTQITASGYLMSSLEGLGGPISKVERNDQFNMFRITADGYLQEAKPYYPNYVFPLTVGQTWKQKVVLTKSTSEGVSVEVDMESRVVGWELVTVPAGNFMTLKIESGGWYFANKKLGRSWKGKVKETLWLSPDAKNAVRYEYQDMSFGNIDNHEITELQSVWLTY